MTITAKHAGAVALTGWLLIAPPTSVKFPRGKLDAPLSEWVKVRPAPYRSKDECEHLLDQQRRLTNARNRQIALRKWENAQCVSSADPRLKAKPHP